MPGTVAAPSLSGDLNRVPWAAQSRRVTEIKIIEFFHSHSMEEPSREEVDPFGHLGTTVSDDLCSEQLSSVHATGDADSHLLSTWVVSFVIPNGSLNS
jgi:hypothetical protein